MALIAFFYGITDTSLSLCYIAHHRCHSAFPCLFLNTTGFLPADLQIVIFDVITNPQYCKQELSPGNDDIKEEPISYYFR